MPQLPNTLLCFGCGRRPATIQVVRASGAGRQADALCESCAQLLLGAPARPPASEPSKTPALDGFGRDLTADAAAGRIDPVIGRAGEIEETVEILSRRRKNNAVLIGEPGVGKTAVV